MINTDEKVPSAAQDQWCELAGVIRGSLVKIAEKLPAGTPAEAKDFIAACKDALALETWAETFDSDIEAKKARGPFDP